MQLQNLVPYCSLGQCILAMQAAACPQMHSAGGGMLCQLLRRLAPDAWHPKLQSARNLMAERAVMMVLGMQLLTRGDMQSSGSMARQ